MAEEIKWEKQEFIDCGDTLVISKSTILRSAAGYYIGRLCKTIKCANSNERPGCIEPYDRMTGYMSYDKCVIYLNSM